MYFVSRSQALRFIGLAMTPTIRLKQTLTRLHAQPVWMDLLARCLVHVAFTALELGRCSPTNRLDWPLPRRSNGSALGAFCLR